MPEYQLTVWPDAALHNARLRFVIEKQKEQFRGSQLAMGTCWSGPKTLFEEPDAAALESFIQEQLPADALWEICAWGNWMEQGQQVGPHDHRVSHLGGENQWAGIYFLTYGSAVVLGEEQEEIEPVPGRLLIFPATLPHFVRPHDSVEPRVSIAFNVRSISKED